MAEKLFEGKEQAELERRSRIPPVVAVFDNFLSEGECDHIVSLAQPFFQRATVCGSKAGMTSSGRTGSNCWLKHNTDSTTQSIVTRIAKLLEVPASHSESLQCIHYDASQQYRNHYDGWMHDDSEKTQRTLRRGGQRIWTALCYLNTVAKGGSTRFTKLKRDVSTMV